MTNQEADLAADLAADEEIEVIESGIEVSVCVPGAVCAAPVPDEIAAAAERAPLLEHAKQRKAKAKKGSKTPDKKKSTARKHAGAKMQ